MRAERQRRELQLVSVCLRRPWPAMTTGLSPRTRRNLQDGWRTNTTAGPISAYAEEPEVQSRTNSLPTAYPRVRGATRTRAICVVALLGLSRVRGATASPLVLEFLAGGLSPRTRTNLIADAHRLLRHRPISAYAEEPRRYRPDRRAAWAYLRVRGGTVAKRTDDQTATGLSARTRRNPLCARRGSASLGPISAYAEEP